MTQTPYEVGSVLDSEELHAVRRTAFGLMAQCGAGKIVIVVTGRFDPTQPKACEACIQATSGDTSASVGGTVPLPEAGLYRRALRRAGVSVPACLADSGSTEVASRERRRPTRTGAHLTVAAAVSTVLSMQSRGGEALP